jgi:hypothetical protein
VVPTPARFPLRNLQTACDFVKCLVAKGAPHARGDGASFRASPVLSMPSAPHTGGRFFQSSAQSRHALCHHPNSIAADGRSSERPSRPSGRSVARTKSKAFTRWRVPLGEGIAFVSWTQHPGPIEPRSMPADQHDASASTVGYIYQVNWRLVELLQRTLDRPESTRSQPAASRRDAAEQALAGIPAGGRRARTFCLSTGLWLFRLAGVPAGQPADGHSSGRSLLTSPGHMPDRTRSPVGGGHWLSVCSTLLK